MPSITTFLKCRPRLFHQLCQLHLQRAHRRRQRHLWSKKRPSQLICPNQTWKEKSMTMIYQVELEKMKIVHQAWFEGPTVSFGQLGSFVHVTQIDRQVVSWRLHLISNVPKGGLISEIFLLRLQSPKKEHYTLKGSCSWLWFGTFFLRLEQK